MTPIIGHLWLRVKAAQSKTGNQFSIVAPKISSRGASCGTVDILESGGATFISDPVAVVETCHREGSVLCRQDKRLTPIDEVLMERRRHTNTMKNAAWVYASILAKKIALGCTHAIIDVKVGRDSKMLAPWQKDGGKSLLDTQADAELVASNRLETFQSLLKSMGVTGLTCHDGYLEQSCAGKLSTLQKIRWIMTNADMPQCRAVGRQLILLHMDQLITGNREKLLHDDEGNNLYRNWYRKHLPCVCGLEPSEANWQALHAQWAQLKKNSLPYLTKGQFNSHPFFASDNEDADNKEIDRKSDFSASSLEKSLPLNEFAHDLSLLTLPLGPYLADSRSEQPVTIRQIDAYRLDLLFEWLCGDDRYDPEVGIWLHKLPGEVMENPKEKPFISIFYRPSRHTEQAVAQRVRDLIWFGVKVKQPED
jgi:hypothetical protein